MKRNVIKYQLFYNRVKTVHLGPCFRSNLFYRKIFDNVIRGDIFRKSASTAKNAKLDDPSRHMV